MKKNTSYSKLSSRGEHSLLTTVAALLLALWFVIFPYQAGLFNGFRINFEKPILQASMYGFILLFAVAIALFQFRPRLDRTQTVLAVGVWLLPASYLLSSTVAVADYEAKWMVLIAGLNAAFFFIAIIAARSRIGIGIIGGALAGSGYLIVLWGLLNVFGLAYQLNAIWESLPGQYRLTSVFQYSNTYASFLTALFLVGLYYAVHTENKYWRAVNVTMLVPVFVSFMLTLSRGALVLLPIVVLLTLPFLRLSKQLLFILYMIVSAGASFVVLGKINANMLKVAGTVVISGQEGDAALLSLFDSLAVSSWLPLLLVSLVLGTAVWFGHERWTKWLEARCGRFEHSRWSLAIVPVTVVVITAVVGVLLLGSSAVRGLLPASIADRIANINFDQHSVLERETFFKNAMSISADYPLLGGGGGAWSALYQQYQTNPYVSQQAHNYFIQMLVETGWIGLIIHAVFFIAVFAFYIRGHICHSGRRGTHLALFIWAMSMLIHSFIDFDLSYVLLSALLFAVLGAMTGVYGKVPIEQPASNSAGASSTSRKPAGIINTISFIAPALLAVAAIVAITYSARQLSAIDNYSKAIELANQQANVTDIMAPLDDAIAANPDHPVYSLQKIDWMIQAYQHSGEQSYLDEANSTITRLYAAEPYNEELNDSRYYYYKTVGDVSAVHAVLDEGIVKFPWNIALYERAMIEYAEAGLAAGAAEAGNRDKLWSRVDSLQSEITERIEQLKLLPSEQLQGMAFNITNGIRQAVGLVAYGRGDFALAEQWLKPAAAGDISDSSTRGAVRVYLAVLAATGRSDETLKKSLIAADEKELSKLEALIAQKP